MFTQHCCQAQTIMVASLNIPISIKWNTFVSVLFQEHLSVYSTNRGQTLYLSDVKRSQYFHSQRHNSNKQQGIPVSMQTNVRVWSIKVLHKRFIPLFGNGFRWESQALRHSLHSLDRWSAWPQWITWANLVGQCHLFGSGFRCEGSAVCSIWDISCSVVLQQLRVTWRQTSIHLK